MGPRELHLTLIGAMKCTVILAFDKWKRTDECRCENILVRDSEAKYRRHRHMDQLRRKVHLGGLQHFVLAVLKMAIFAFNIMCGMVSPGLGFLLLSLCDTK